MFGARACLERVRDHPLWGERARLSAGEGIGASVGWWPGGYEPAAGYERDGYERVPEPPRAGNGYEGGNENYEQRGGYGEPQASPRGGAAGNSNRRSLDWLDD